MHLSPLLLLPEGCQRNNHPIENAFLGVERNCTFKETMSPDQIDYLKIKYKITKQKAKKLKLPLLAVRRLSEGKSLIHHTLPRGQAELREGWLFLRAAGQGGLKIKP